MDLNIKIYVFNKDNNSFEQNREKWLRKEMTNEQLKKLLIRELGKNYNNFKIRNKYYYKYYKKDYIGSIVNGLTPTKYNLRKTIEIKKI